MEAWWRYGGGMVEARWRHGGGTVEASWIRRQLLTLTFLNTLNCIVNVLLVTPSLWAVYDTPVFACLQALIGLLLQHHKSALLTRGPVHVCESSLSPSQVHLPLLEYTSSSRLPCCCSSTFDILLAVTDCCYLKYNIAAQCSSLPRLWSSPFRDYDLLSSETMFLSPF